MTINHRKENDRMPAKEGGGHRRTHTHTYTHNTHTQQHTRTYTQRERDGERYRETQRERERLCVCVCVEGTGEQPHPTRTTKTPLPRLRQATMGARMHWLAPRSWLRTMPVMASERSAGERIGVEWRASGVASGVQRWSGEERRGVKLGADRGGKRVRTGRG